MKTSESGKTPRFYAVLLAAFLLVIGLLAWRASVKMMGMSSASAASPSQLQGAKSGDAVKLVMEIEETDGKSTAKGKILERRDDTHYQRTANDVATSFDHTTKVVMGTTSDIHRGAVVHIAGKWSAGNSVRADQMVVLTGYVQVQ